MKLKLTLVVAAMAAAGLAHAVATPEEAARLGKDLTPWGAEKAGNKDGTIPAYSGGLPRDLIPGFDSNKSIVNGRQYMPDPFKDDKPIFRITAANLSQYADKLSDTQQGMFKNDPAYYMDVYPSHRTANPPKSYSDASIKNATRCRTEQNGEALKGCKGGTPFPVPKTGQEVMWNLQIAPLTGVAYEIDAPQYYVDRNGTLTLTGEVFGYQYYPYHDTKISLEDYESGDKPYGNIWFQTAYERRRPPRVAGEVQIIKQFTNNSATAGWSYQPGNRRVRVNPNAAYDFPISSAGGAAFYDEAYGFQGRLDRFDWKLLGKKEMVMPYNVYKLAYGAPDAVMMAGHPKPDAMRWEMHRAWVVEATRKSGVRHAFSKRRFYVDEDAAHSVLSDQYDDTGKNVRGGFTSELTIWDKQTAFQYFFNIDLATGVYWSLSALGDSAYGGNKFRDPDTGIGGINNGPQFANAEWTPEAMARRSSK